MNDTEANEKLAEFIQSDQFAWTLEKITKNAVSHILVRFGFRVGGDSEIVEMQQDMAFIRKARDGDILTRLTRLEDDMREHIEDCNKRQLQILAAFDKGEMDRNGLKRRMDAALIFLVVMLVGIVGVFLKREFGL